MKIALSTRVELNLGEVNNLPQQCGNGRRGKQSI